VEVESADDLEPAFDLMVRQHVDAVLIDNFAFFFQNLDRIVGLTTKHRLPAIAEGRGFSEAGLLVSYGVDYADLSRKTAVYVDKIFRVAKPADLPVERASKFEFIVNLKTAKVGITIPQAAMLRADEVIQ
jgi:putative ABC transport system substrate-binding protein